MYFTLIILAIIVCVILGFFILIQNPKGGGLSSGFSGSNNIMGVQRTGDFLEKGTWVLTALLMVFAIAINVAIPRGGAESQSQELQKQITKPQVNPLSQPSTAPLPAASDTGKK
ncbi:preprotein translocase subunit SecG [Hufsiella ginkgonis]|uniref:Protein-export membrane protein SecG n=1 Tax=Hufsiella ginkgonis TaxID=2695274 RepID=A0A7K1Y2R8_9SPHI|nr:preprotein translocase subunit SecG [Hufsiella ginkgonis]MXV17550.1 preprotein translocase subunit SecG [Hufsiella ginkgonis]